MSDYDVHHDENLRRHVEDAYRPIDLFDKEKDCFVCPKCNEQLSLSSARPVENKFNKFLVQASCSACKEWLCFKLPGIKKKRVYLDQSIISDLYNVEVFGASKIDSPIWRERLLTKINLAKRLQKACFIISDIHVSETVATPEQSKKDGIWIFANRLADGNIAGDLSDALDFEIRNLLNEINLNQAKSPINCYMRSEIDTWSIHKPVLMTNSWQLQLNQEWLGFRDASHENFKKILEKQKEQVGVDATVESCIEYLKNVYLEDFIDGIKYAQQLAATMQMFSNSNNLDQATEKPQVLDIASIPKNNGYGALIFRATEVHTNVNAQVEALSVLLKQVELQGLNTFPTLKIEAILCGEILHRWAHGLQANPNKFNENYGSSKFMDISHLAVFLPVVDVLTVDKATFSRCQQSEIKLEIDNYSCKLLRMSETQPELEVWLDDLLAEPETDEFRCARRLFFGRNLAEEKYHDDQFISDILDSLESNKKTSV